MAEKVQDKKQKNPQQGGKGSEDYRGQKPGGDKGPQRDGGDQKKGDQKKKW